MVVNYRATGLFLFLCNALAVSAISLDQAKIQLEKLTNRKEFIRKMRIANELNPGDEILTGDERMKFNQKLISKSEPRFKGGKVLQSSRRLEDADDEEEEWYEEEAKYYNWNDLGVNIAEYSLKYHKCTNLLSFVGEEDNKDENENGPFAKNRFVTFRLCPTDTCSADGWDGCRDEYGEYMMELSDFIEAQSKYEEDVFEQYCNYCETCMYFENYFYGNNRHNRHLAHACKYYDDCSSYADVCGVEGEEGEEGEEPEERLTYQDLSECIAIEEVIPEDDKYDDDDGDGDDVVQYFLGLACRSSLEIGLFSDEDCMNYVGDSDTVYNITGYELSLNEDTMGPILSHECIPCRESTAPYKISYGDAEDKDDILEVCEEIYLASAKCDARLWDVEYESAVEEYNAERTCEYIENVIKGNLNRYGVQEKGDNDVPDLFHRWVPQRFWPDEDIILSQDEVAYLTMGFLGCMVMFMYAIYFRRQLANLPAPLLQTNTYPGGNDARYPTSDETGGGTMSYNPTKSEETMDPVAQARSID